MESKIRQFLTENLLQKIIGLLLGVLLWLVLSNMQDPLISKTMSVPIVYDESWITDNNYIVTAKPGTVQITYRIRKSNISKVKSDDFTASVDLSEYIGSGIREAPEATKFNLVVQKKASASYIEDWEYPKTQSRYVEVVVDTIKSEMYPIEINAQGELADGFQMGDLLVNPVRVRVTGPTSSFANLTSVKAAVDLSKITEENASVTADLHLYDGNDRMISNTSLQLSQDTAEVTVGLLTSKQIGISVERYSGEPASGYVCSNFDYEPKTVTVTGSRAALANVSTIKIPKAGLDISGATESRSFVMNLEDYLASDLSLADGEPETVTITFDIEKLEQRTFLISTDTFQFIGTDDRYSYEIVSPTVEVVLSSFAEELDAFPTTGGHLQGTINVSGMEPDGSTSYVPVMISIDSQYSLVADIIVEIKITQKTEESSASDEQSSAESSSAGPDQTEPETETQETQTSSVSEETQETSRPAEEDTTGQEPETDVSGEPSAEAPAEEKSAS